MLIIHLGLRQETNVSSFSTEHQGLNAQYGPGPYITDKLQLTRKCELHRPHSLKPHSFVQW